MKLGTKISEALSLVGITEDRVSHFLGAPCGCKERAEKLNRLSQWATRVVRGNLDNAKKYLTQLMEDYDGE